MELFRSLSEPPEFHSAQTRITIESGNDTSDNLMIRQILLEQFKSDVSCLNTEN